MAVDPNALVTWANAVTVGRILASPLLFAIIPVEPGGVVGGARCVVRIVRQ